MRAVKCIRCSISIDRTKEDYVSVGGRYSHSKCEAEHSLDSEERKRFNDVVEYVFGKEQVNWGAVQQQAKRYQSEYGYTLHGMARALYYVHSVKRMDFDKAEGIGIVTYYYKEATKYYSRLNEIKANAKGKIDYETVEIEIKPPDKIVKKRKQLELDFL